MRAICLSDNSTEIKRLVVKDGLASGKVYTQDPDLVYWFKFEDHPVVNGQITFLEEGRPDLSFEIVE